MIIGAVTLNSTTPLQGWTETYDPSNLFNSTTGTYTVPQSGVYQVILTFNYTSTVALSLGLLTTSTPRIEVTRNGTAALEGLFSIVTISAVVLSLTVLVGTGQVNLTGVVVASAGDTLQAQYNPGGVTLSATISGPASSRSQLQIRRVA